MVTRNKWYKSPVAVKFWLTKAWIPRTIEEKKFEIWSSGWLIAFKFYKHRLKCRGSVLLNSPDPSLSLPLGGSGNQSKLLPLATLNPAQIFVALTSWPSFLWSTLFPRSAGGGGCDPPLESTIYYNRSSVDACLSKHRCARRWLATQLDHNLQLVKL